MNTPKGSGIAIGIAVGVALGTAFDNIALGIALGVALGAAWEASKSVRGDMDAKEEQPENPVNQARSAERDAHVAAVLAEAKKKGSITNNDVEALLGVSDATAERYLQELEMAGKITQIGTTGKTVSYKIL